MGVISLSRFVELASTANPNHSRFLENVYISLRMTDNYWAANYPAINREAAIRMYESAKDYVQQNGYFLGKGFRPWEVDTQLTESLDRNEPWYGFEFEMGFNSHAARAEVIGHVWDSWDGVAFDGEGEGEYFVEITFTPEERSKFQDGTAQALQFMKYIGENNDKINNTGYEAIGTHFNLSHPALDTHVKQDAMQRVLNNTLASIPKDGHSRLRLFGREYLYGGFFSRSAGPNLWLEGKLFRTTYSSAEFTSYLSTCEGFIRCVTATLQHWEENGRSSTLSITNFLDVVEGTADPIFVSSDDFQGLPYCDYVSGTAYPAGEEETDDDDYEDEDYY